MSSPVIDEFLIDDLNETKISSHGLSVRQVIQVLENKHIVIPNRKHRRGLYLVIGIDNGGNCIAVPVERTYYPRLWRPITAWFCKDSERSLLERKER
jgi:uncharacterized DUF497 family protein